VRSETDEGLRSLLAATLVALPPGDRHAILVTGAGHGKRSAHLAAGLARRLAEAGQETLALSTDLGSPLLADALDVASAPGLSEVLEQARGGTAVRLRAVPVPGLDTLHVVPGGGPPRDGVGLVRPGAVDALFVAFGDAGYDYVVMEAPALLAAPEGRLVARNAEAAILACPDRPSAEELRELRRVLEGLDVRVLGAVSLPAGAADAPGPAEPTARTTTGRMPLPVAFRKKLDGAANGGASSAADARLLLERLRAADRPLTFDELRQVLGDAPPARVRLHLRQLVEAGEVVRRGSGRHSDPYLYGPRES
jgi:Mrp family chromosome partitioning ATPase